MAWGRASSLEEYMSQKIVHHSVKKPYGSLITETKVPDFQSRSHIIEQQGQRIEKNISSLFMKNSTDLSTHWTTRKHN